MKKTLICSNCTFRDNHQWNFADFADFSTSETILTAILGISYQCLLHSRYNFPKLQKPINLKAQYPKYNIFKINNTQ